MTRRTLPWLSVLLAPGLLASSSKAGVILNELMYHPNSPTKTDEWDFIELHNTDAVSVDLSGWCIDGVDFCFPNGASIAPEGYLVIAKDAAAFAARYGLPADGTFAGTLSNSGERLRLQNSANVVIDEVIYEDAGQWPPSADGLGPGLERIVPTLNGNSPRNWRTSIAASGHTAAAANSVLAAALPPWVTDVSHTHDVQPTEPLAVSANVVDATNVELVYRLNFDAEVIIPMFDDGLHNDGVAADNRWGAIIPGQPANKLIRYRIVATGPTGEGRYPRIDDTTLYDGTVVSDPLLSTQLPVFQWFVHPTDYQDALTHFLTDDTEPAVFYYNGRLYDNIQFRVRGQTSRSFAKKHWKFYMPQGHDFDEPALIPVPFDQFNLQCNYSDKAFVREILAYETYRDAGSPSSVAFHVRLHQNGTFFGLYTFAQATDDDYLVTNQIDENGAWYKAFEDCRARSLATLPTKYEKQTRLNEGFEDLFDLILNLTSLSGAARHTYLMNNVNLPGVINYLAVAAIIHNNDHLAKNYMLYRDTEGTGRWTMHPWDMDLTFGRNFGAGGGVLSDGIWADNDDIGIPNVSPSHPLFGDAQHQKFDQIFNRFIEAVHKDPQIREMFHRRLRTLADAFLASTYYDDRIEELVARIAPEASLDRLRPWGQYGQPQTLQQAIDLIRNDFLPRRRLHLLSTHQQPGEIPAAQSPQPRIVINEIMFQPAIGDSGEFVELYNPSATESVDVSHWRLDGLALTIPAGTVILPDNYAVFVKHDPTFRATYGGARFVPAQFTGTLDNAGERIALFDREDREIDVVRYSAAPPWPASAVGGGHSLELIDPSRDNQRPGNWAASLVVGGTPGAPNSVMASIPPIPAVFVNEALPINQSVNLDEQGESAPWIELYNPTAATIDLSGMYLTNDYDVPFRWPFPPETRLCGGQWLLIWADGEQAEGPLHANFALNPAGGAIGIYTAAGLLVDHLNYGSGANNMSYGKYPDGAATDAQLPLPTPTSANTGGVSSVFLNEYNGVSNSNFLKNGGADTFWGRVQGNGGDWFELVVAEDHVDMRNWKLVVRENVGSPSATTDVLTLTDHPLWSDLRSGTIITVSENLADDPSYAPIQGDWWINVRASNSGTGEFISADNFPVSHDNWQLTILDAHGRIVFGPAGEGVNPSSGIGSDEVFKLEEDPSPFISVQSNYKDGTSSTFGAPNRYSAGTLVQSFDLIRDVIEPCSINGDCDDGRPCTEDSCTGGECTHVPFSPCYRLSLSLPDSEGASPESPIGTGQQLQVTLNVSGLTQPINGTQTILAYDTNRLAFSGITTGDAAGSPWDSALPVFTNNDAAAGILQYSTILIGASTMADATVATVHFTVINGEATANPTRVRFSQGCLPEINKITTSQNNIVLPEIVDSPLIYTSSYPTLRLSLSACSVCAVAPNTVEIELRVSDLNEPINGIQALIQYDPQILDSPTVLPGDAAGSPWDASIVALFEDNGGDLSLGLLLVGTGAAPDAVVAHLSFTIVGNGSSTVSLLPGADPFLTKITAADDNAVTIPYLISTPAFSSGLSSKADLNGDGLRDGADIQLFVDVLLQPSSFNDAERCAADVNVDGTLSISGDVPAMVNCLLLNVCPCP